VLAVENGTEGFSFGRKERKMGVKGCPASELNFKECFVPDHLVLISPAHNLEERRSNRKTLGRLLDYTLASSRAGVCAFGTGAARGAYETAMEFALKTEVDGKRMINHQWVQSMLAQMYRNVAVSRLSYVESNYANGMYGVFSLVQIKPFYYALKWMPEFVLEKIIAPCMQSKAITRFIRKIYLNHRKERDFQRTAGWGSLAKFTGTDAGVRNCHMAVELMGQAGLRQDRKAEKMLRDAKLLQIYEGTNQLNRINLFKCLMAKDHPQISVFINE
jgi:alkylation response protein AidB-like acyl-CoA dehydrogenase